MKRGFVVVAVIIATMFVQSVAAQAPQKSEAEKAAMKAKRELIMQTRLNMLGDELQLTDVQKQQFEPIYRKYRQDIQRATTRDAHVKKEDMTNENALKVLSARLSNQINTCSVKQRYLYIFNGVIEPLQIAKLYRVDERISREARKIVKYNEKK